MKEIVKSNYLLLVVFFIYAGIGLCLHIFFPGKGNFELLVNQHHHPLLDVLFYYVTYLGHGKLLIPITIAASMKKIYYGAIPMVTFLATTAIVQSLKRTLFAHYPRPSKFFEHLDLHIVKFHILIVRLILTD